MAKDKLTEYDATAANNTVVGDVNLAENSCLPSDLNNAVREVMSHQKEAFGSGTPLYVDQTNNRVGVGNSAPSTALEVDADGATVLTVDRATSNGDIIELQKGGSKVGSIGTRTDSSLFVTFRTEANTDGCGLSGSGSNTGVIIPTDGDGTAVDNHIGLGAAGTRFKDIYLGGNLYIGGTGSSNALSDIETGSFTPTVTDTSGNTGSASEATGYYRKIGGLVHVELRLTNINTSGLTSTDDVRVASLPFTHSSRTGSVQAIIGDIYHNHINLDHTGVLMGILGEGNDYFVIVETRDSAGDHDILVSDLTSGSADLLISATYHTEQ